MGFWNELLKLQNLSTWIQWVSIILIFLSGLLQIGKLAVDKRIKYLDNQVHIEKEKVQEIQEKKLHNKIDSLEENLNNKEKEITELSKKTDYVDPYKQPIRSGVATVIINVKSDEKVNTHYMDRGGYIAFVKDGKSILIMSVSDSYAKQLGNGTLQYKATMFLDTTDKSIGKKLPFLLNTELIQIEFIKISKNSDIINGDIICTFNGNARIEIKVPAQKMRDKYILSTDLENMNKLLK